MNFELLFDDRIIIAIHAKTASSTRMDVVGSTGGCCEIESNTG
jgi:hypothetical protein